MYPLLRLSGRCQGQTSVALDYVLSNHDHIISQIMINVKVYFQYGLRAGGYGVGSSAFQAEASLPSIKFFIMPQFCANETCTKRASCILVYAYFIYNSIIIVAISALHSTLKYVILCQQHGDSSAYLRNCGCVQNLNTAINRHSRQ
jgi:hypothetical protein